MLTITPELLEQLTSGRIVIPTSDAYPALVNLYALSKQITLSETLYILQNGTTGLDSNFIKSYNQQQFFTAVYCICNYMLTTMVTPDTYDLIEYWLQVLKIAGFIARRDQPRVVGEHWPIAATKMVEQIGEMSQEDCTGTAIPIILYLVQGMPATALLLANPDIKDRWGLGLELTTRMALWQ